MVPRRAELLNRQASAALKLGDMDQTCTFVELAGTAALALGSDLRYSEACETYQHMQLTWPHERRVTGTYEGAQSRSAKEELYRRGIELLTPVAVAILEEVNVLFLQNTGEIQVIGPVDDGSGGLETRFELSWPEQKVAKEIHGPRESLQPVRIIVNYSQDFLHAHLAGSTVGFWPFQVRNQADAERQKGILAAIIELELHQRIFETDWHILPISQQLV